MTEKIVFFGSSKYVIPLIDILRRKVDISLVITTETNNQPVPKYCIQNNISYLSVASLQDEAVQKQITEKHAEVAVLASFGILIPDAILHAFPKGIINIHPSYLPKYRGPSPVQETLLNGDSKAGVSIMLLDDKLDHGPILAQKYTDIAATDTAESLYNKLFQEGGNMIVSLLDDYLSGKLQPIPQVHQKATYTNHLSREDGFIDLSEIEKMNTLEIANWKLKIAQKIRAYYPWPGVWTKMNVGGKEKIVKLLPNIHRHSEPSRHAELPPAGGSASYDLQPDGIPKQVRDDESFLLQVEGKKPMSVKDFINGYPEGKQFLTKLV